MAAAGNEESQDDEESLEIGDCAAKAVAIKFTSDHLLQKYSADLEIRFDKESGARTWK